MGTKNAVWGWDYHSRLLLALFVLSKSLLQLPIPDRSKYIEGVVGNKKWCNYDMTVSNVVNLCDPRTTEDDARTSPEIWKTDSSDNGMSPSPGHSRFFRGKIWEWPWVRGYKERQCPSVYPNVHYIITRKRAICMNSENCLKSFLWTVNTNATLNF